jgi:NTP pyrophosphatase (non-canonical NTP hydrolase)
MEFYEIQKLCHEQARENGWYDYDLNGSVMWNDHKRVSEILMLIVTELGEAQECVRDDSIEAMFNFAFELADAAMILMGLADRLGIDLEDYIQKKCEYNKKRGHRHGGKRC